MRHGLANLMQLAWTRRSAQVGVPCFACNRGPLAFTLAALWTVSVLPQRSAVVRGSGTTHNAQTSDYSS